MREPWKLSQRFSVRASTMLILYLPLLYAVALLSRVAPDPLAGYLSLYVGASAEYEVILLLLASILGLSFFIASAVKRNPQFQFLLEFVAGLSLIFALPTY